MFWGITTTRMLYNYNHVQFWEGVLLFGGTISDLKRGSAPTALSGCTSGQYAGWKLCHIVLVGDVIITFPRCATNTPCQGEKDDDDEKDLLFVVCFGINSLRNTANDTRTAKRHANIRN